MLWSSLLQPGGSTFTRGPVSGRPALGRRGDLVLARYPIPQSRDCSNPGIRNLPHRGSHRPGQVAYPVGTAGPVAEVRLEGLSQAEVLRLIRHLSGQTGGAERFSQRLHYETGGNPFFLLETLRVMFEAGILWQDETGWSTEWMGRPRTIAN